MTEWRSALKNSDNNYMAVMQSGRMQSSGRVKGENTRCGMSYRLGQGQRSEYVFNARKKYRRKLWSAVIFHIMKESADIRAHGIWSGGYSSRGMCLLSVMRLRNFS